ncbi:hypothetical protein SAMN05421766_10613 [Zobellia uliginosa]|uniref:Uncharacterized protein n=1 Tax=Zobellia uliginosa TaxID=143224 RepID=A0ABY1KZW9_9FLAO|nr:hypothetical protein SAMN05421766_10613 [Zobellia uliginosa]
MDAPSAIVTLSPMASKQQELIKAKNHYNMNCSGFLLQNVIQFHEPKKCSISM